MGSHTFKWEHPEASQVYVTGTFDDWGKTQKLEKLDNGFFAKTVRLPKAEKTLYKFVVDDNNWTTNSHLPIEDDGHGNQNNVLQASDIEPDTVSAATSSVGPSSTTAALAGAVPKESQKTTTHGLPGAFPETPAVESMESEKSIGGPPGTFPQTPAAEPSAFSVNPIPASQGAGNPIHLQPGEPVPAPSTYNKYAIATHSYDDPELVAADKAAQESTYSVNPIPATAGTGNPVNLQPGEPVPDASTLTGHTLQSTVKLDEDSYNKSDAGVSFAPPAGAQAKKESEVNPAEAGLFGVPPVSRSTIPESSLPAGEGTTSDSALGAGIFSSSAGAGSTTAALAGQVPKEERGVPIIVKESQQEAHFAPEASANPVAVQEKKTLEEELKSKVPEEPATTGATTTEKVTAAASGAAAATAATVAGYAAYAQDTASKAVGSTSAEPTSTKADTTVPAVVKESIAEAHTSPEAAANPVAVQEKKTLEEELKSKVPEEPATTGATTTEKVTATASGAAAATAATVAGYAAYAQDTASKAVGSTSTEPTFAEVDKTVPDVVKESIAEAHASPEAATNPIAVEEKSAVEKELESKIRPTESSGEPAPTITSATTETAPAPTPSTPTKKTSAPVAAAETPAAKSSLAAESTPTTPATSSKPAPASPATPASVGESSTASPSDAAKTDKKNKRKSIFKRLKSIF